jgi:sarcosine oxidase subunit gamma
MPVSVPEPRSPLVSHLKPGRYGAASDKPVAISEVRLAIVQVQARKGRAADVAAALQQHLGVAIPRPGQFTRANELSMVTIGPDTWLVTTAYVQEGHLYDRLAGLLRGLAAVTDQTHGKTALKISGAMARSVLDKGCRVDLHPRAFATGRAAVTPIDHVTVVLTQTDDAPTYYLIAPSTLVASLFEFLTASAAEFGYTLTAAQRSQP